MKFRSTPHLERCKKHGKRDLRLTENIIPILVLAQKELEEGIPVGLIFSGFHKLSSKYPKLFPRRYFSNSAHSRKLEEILFLIGVGGGFEQIYPNYILKTGADIGSFIESLKESYINKYNMGEYNQLVAASKRFVRFVKREELN